MSLYHYMYILNALSTADGALLRRDYKHRLCVEAFLIDILQVSYAFVTLVSYFGWWAARYSDGVMPRCF